MENGAETAKEVETAELQPVSNAAEESGVFHETMDTPKESFYTPHHHDTRDFVFRRGIFEDQKVGELTDARAGNESCGDGLGDAQVTGPSPEEVEAVVFEKDAVGNAELSSLALEEQKVVLSEKFEESLDAPVNARILEKQGAVDSALDSPMNSHIPEKQGAVDSVEMTPDELEAAIKANGENNSLNARGTEKDEAVCSLEKAPEESEAEAKANGADYPVNAQSREKEEEAISVELTPNEPEAGVEENGLNDHVKDRSPEKQEAAVSLEMIPNEPEAEVEANGGNDPMNAQGPEKQELSVVSLEMIPNEPEAEVEASGENDPMNAQTHDMQKAVGSMEIIVPNETEAEVEANGENDPMNAQSHDMQEPVSSTEIVPDEPEAEVEANSENDPMNARSLDKPEAVSFVQKIDVPDETDRAVASEAVVNVDGDPSVLADGVGDADKGSSLSADGEEKDLVGNQSENGELNRVNLDVSHPIVIGHPENGECDGIEPREQAPCENGVMQMLDVSVVSDFPSSNEARDFRTEDGHPSQDITGTDKGIQVVNHALTGIKKPAKQGECKIPNSDSNSGMRKDIEKESVLVEDLGDSSSTDDDDNRITDQSVPSVTSRHMNSGSPVLPSRPAGLGSSIPGRGPSLPSRPAGLSSSAPAGAFSSPSRPAGFSPSAPAGLPSQPSPPAGLGPSSPLLEPASRSVQQPRANGSTTLHRQSQPSDELSSDDTEENDETREKLQMIRVKFLRLARRLGQTPHNVVVAQVLYRLGLAEQLRRNTNRPGVFSFDRASVMAEQLEAAGQEPLDFSCTVMVIGKTGVGKSATINSIFDEVKFNTNAFQFSTEKVQEIVGTVQGIKVRVIDTPGLFSSSLDQRKNEKVLRSLKKFITKTPPDIVLYFDRLDMHSRDYGDVPLLRTVTDVFGASIWFNAIIVLTHAASAPPDGPNGTPLSYEMFVTQRSHVVQQAIRQAAGDVRLMNPVSLVENHSACRINRAGQRVLPNGQVWKPQLLLLSFASKILAEANTLLKLQDSPPGKPFGSRTRVPTLPYLLTSLIQSRPQLKLPEEQFGEDDDLDEDLDEASDSDGGSDYDELPPFKCLNKAQLEKLSKEQKKAYFEELDYREKLFFRKQLKEERKRRKLMRKMAEAVKDLPNDNYNNDNIEDENSGPASVPVPLPDYALPTSFDSDNPTHRYRSLDSSSQWLVRPVLDSQGWDHDVGYEGLNVERLFVVKDKMPLSISGQLTKDKKEFNVQMEVASSIKHGEGKATSLNLDMQTVGKDMAYTLRGETRVKYFRRNNTAAGLSVTVLGDSVSAGMKIEDKLIITKGFSLLMSGGAMTGRGDVAYGGRLEATLRDKDYPVGRMLSTLALSAVDWHGDLALGCNFQSQIPLGRGTNLIAHANLSNKGSGQVGIRLNSSEHLQIVLLALVPIFRSFKRFLSDSCQSM